ncbi:MAG: MerR family transcriptional regulator [Eubacteriales bacterium]|nr:MerR family transcriptional regulator [Eubacteriales bacterium]
MDKKMTSGEIAKKAGISQKAVRLYDEKGLLKPSDYSEGNYRLYDDEALLVLEKIIALKQIGFSLEEIRENLVVGNQKGIAETLQEQIDMMEAKRYELEKAITRMKAVLARSNGEPDWDDVAEILKSMQVDQNKDEGHYFALEHTKTEMDWYVRIYQLLQIKPGERVLDLGCGYAKLWRNNWAEIPKNVQVDAYDLAGSWADDFGQFIKENSSKLAENTKIDLFFEDVEADATWKHIQSEEKYSKVIAHYVLDDLKDADAFMQHVNRVLADDGIFSLNNFGNVQVKRYKYWLDVCKEAGVNVSVLEKEFDRKLATAKECKCMLEKYFSSVEEEIINCSFTYNNADDILKDLSKCFSGNDTFVKDNFKKLEAYFAKEFESGDITIIHDERFWRIQR